MKKLFSIILSLALVLSVCALSGCSGEIKQGSKIQRMILTFGFYDAEDNLVDTKDVQAELYLNFAPETTARFIELAEDGYFDNTCVSDVAAGYFEFGGYEYVDGKFTAKSFDEQKYPQLKGEFYNNGFAGAYRAIDAIAIGGTGIKLAYRVKTEKGWLPWVYSNKCNIADPIKGYAGNMGDAIINVQIKVKA